MALQLLNSVQCELDILEIKGHVRHPAAMFTVGDITHRYLFLNNIRTKLNLAHVRVDAARASELLHPSHVFERQNRVVPNKEA